MAHRISRLPTTRPSSIDRKTSIEFSAPNSAKRLKRTPSCDTPTTTPLRRTLAFSNGFQTPIDRKQINEQAIRVVETLREHFGADYLPQGLRSMSTKQFITTMTYFMKMVIGNSRGCRLATDKLTIDDITKYLIEVGYAVNKQSMSWMKTPNAPHAFNNLVDLLQWLCNFLPPDAEAHPFESIENLEDVDKCFPNIEYVGLFLASIEDNFSLWNNQQDEECESSKALLIDKYIYMHTGISSKAQIEIEIARNKREHDDQLKKRFMVQEQKKLKDLLTTEEQIQADIKQLLAVSKEKASERNEAHSQLHQQEQSVKELSEKVSELKKSIARQPYTRALLEQKIAKLTKQRQHLEVQKNALNQLKEMGLGNQIQLARTLTQQNEVAGRFNNMIHEKFLDIGETDWYSFKVTDLTIDESDMTNLRSQIDRILRNFDEIQQRNHNASDNIRGQIKTLEVRLQAAQANHTIEMIKYQNLVEQTTTLEAELNEVQSELLSACRLRQSAIVNVTDEIESLQLSIDTKSTTISTVTTQIKKVRQDNENAMQEYERKAEELIHIKRERHKFLEIALGKLQESAKAMQKELNQQ